MEEKRNSDLDDILFLILFFDKLTIILTKEPANNYFLTKYQIITVPYFSSSATISIILSKMKRFVSYYIKQLQFNRVQCLNTKNIKIYRFMLKT